MDLLHGEDPVALSHSSPPHFDLVAVGRVVAESLGLHCEAQYERQDAEAFAQHLRAEPGLATVGEPELDACVVD